jgi:hypothetical protein
MTRQTIDLRGLKAVEIRTSGDFIVDQTGSERLGMEADTTRCGTLPPKHATLLGLRL